MVMLIKYFIIIIIILGHFLREIEHFRHVETLEVKSETLKWKHACKGLWELCMIVNVRKIIGSVRSTLVNFRCLWQIPTPNSNFVYNFLKVFWFAVLFSDFK